LVASPGGVIREVEQQPAVARQKSAASGWTPVPVPPPLYLHKPQAQPIVPAAQPGELVAQLRAAALAAEEAFRAAHAEPEVTPIRPVQTPVHAPTIPSRWAAMGRLAVGSGGQNAATPKYCVAGVTRANPLQEFAPDPGDTILRTIGGGGCA